MITQLLLVPAALLLSPAVALAEEGTPARPTGEMKWAPRIQKDYPKGAIENATSRTVRLRVAINKKGRVAGCEILATSGSSALDEAACRGMTKHARFDPAEDGQGQATGGSYALGITYVAR